MPTLTVHEFSCLKDAKFKLAKVNVIIGPQGSGKSVTTKLFYFCADILDNFISHCERGLTLSEYKKYIARQFNLWFPAQAWGGGRFNILYVAGEFSIRILRRLRDSRPGDEVSIKFSEWFEDAYEAALRRFERKREREEIARDSQTELAVFEESWRLRDIIVKDISRDLGEEYIGGQTFVPAGRAFFTSIGRLVAGFDHAGALDPVTLKFARLFASMRDRLSFGSFQGRTSEEINKRRRQFMISLFGGEIMNDGETEFVQATDGRRIPFSSLSSGQQELLPMWSLIDYYSQQDDFLSRRPDRGRRFTHLTYVEEPEAHLFPSAQGLLLEYMIGSMLSRAPRSLILTTHSPYIMSKLNVFLKAGQLSRRKKRNQEINDIVPRECWISEDQITALAIRDGQLIDIVDSDLGLIDADYLDEISEDISREFSALLDIESRI